MSMVDEREPWEISLSLWCQVAAGYLYYLDMDPANVAPYEMAFKVQSGGLREWALERIKRAVDKANATIAEHPDARQITVRCAVPHCTERLQELGLDGNVQNAGTTRIEEPMTAPDPALVALARAYVDAYDAWQASLSTPPFNAEKPPDHQALCSAGRDAWRAFDQALQKREIVTGDRLGLARGLAGEGEGERK